MFATHSVRFLRILGVVLLLLAGARLTHRPAVANFGEDGGQGSWGGRATGLGCCLTDSQIATADIHGCPRLRRL